MAPITKLIKAGDHIILTGLGSYADPYVINAALEITGMLLPGDNVTITGGGTVDDPYVVSAVGGDIVIEAAYVKAGPNIVISGDGTETDPYVIALAPRGEPVNLLPKPGGQSVDGLTVRRNPDGSATLDGHVWISGPIVAGEPVWFAMLPPGFAPPDGTGMPATGYVSYSNAPVALRVDLNPGAGSVFVMTPDIAEGQRMTFSLDNLTYWPGA